MDSPTSRVPVENDVEQQSLLLNALQNRALTPSQFIAWMSVYDTVHRGYPKDCKAVASLSRLVQHVTL